MPGPPEGIDLARHRDSLGGRPLFRYVVLSVVLGLLVLGLADVFGQNSQRSVAESSAARLEVDAPIAVRGGLFFQGRFRIEARRPLEHATLVLERGWQEQLSINTIVPAPVEEESRDGRLALDFGAIRPGEVVVAYLQFQVNPAQWYERRPQDVLLAEGDATLVRIQRTLTVYP